MLKQMLPYRVDIKLEKNVEAGSENGRVPLGEKRLDIHVLVL